MTKLKNSNYNIQIPDIILEGGDRRRTIMISSVSDPHLHYLIPLLLTTWLGAGGCSYLTSPRYNKVITSIATHSPTRTWGQLTSLDF